MDAHRARELASIGDAVIRIDEFGRVAYCNAMAGMFKDALRVTTTRHGRELQQVTGRGCGRPMPISAQALELAEIEARRLSESDLP